MEEVCDRCNLLTMRASGTSFQCSSWRTNLHLYGYSQSKYTNLAFLSSETQELHHGGGLWSTQPLYPESFEMFYFFGWDKWNQQLEKKPTQQSIPDSKPKGYELSLIFGSLETQQLLRGGGLWLLWPPHPEEFENKLPHMNTLRNLAFLSPRT